MTGDVAFATKPALAAAMVARAVAGGVPARWVAGDEVYGGDPKLARAVERLGLGYAAAIASTTMVDLNPVRRQRVADVAADLPASGWEERSTGAGAHGQRYHRWAWVDLHPPVTTGGGGRWSLLIRATLTTGQLTYYRCYAPSLASLTQLVAVAGRRWAIEESFQAAKGLAGLDEHQVRGWTPWRRWSLLAMCAHALLAIITAVERAAGPPPAGLIAMTCAEVRRLLVLALATSTDITTELTWSRWRRRSQHRVRISRY